VDGWEYWWQVAGHGLVMVNCEEYLCQMALLGAQHAFLNKKRALPLTSIQNVRRMKIASF
jgi:hypothetical protein